jgi:hypothetical protein
MALQNDVPPGLVVLVCWNFVVFETLWGEVRTFPGRGVPSYFVETVSNRRGRLSRRGCRVIACAEAFPHAARLYVGAAGHAIRYTSTRGALAAASVVAARNGT